MKSFKCHDSLFSGKVVLHSDNNVIILHVERETANAIRCLGVAQMVARYLGVVEAAGSNPVTQTRKNGNRKVPVFPLFSSFFRTFGCGFFCFFGSKKQTEKTPKFGLVHNLVHSFIWHFSKVGRGHAEKSLKNKDFTLFFWYIIQRFFTRKEQKHGKYYT